MPRPLPPLPLWGARLADKLKRDGFSVSEISKLLKYSERCIYAVLRHRREHGTHRTPRQGQGRRDCKNWVFAGPRRQATLALLETVKQAGDDRDLLREVHVRFRNRATLAGIRKLPAYRTLCKALQVHLDYRRKRVSPPSALPPPPPSSSGYSGCVSRSCRGSLASATRWHATSGKLTC